MKLALIVFGASMLGWMIPEFLGAMVKHAQSMLLNVWCGTACALLAAGLAL